MKVAAEHNWEPDPQLLAAYFDGEFEGCPDLADLRLRIEAWLGQHPEAAVDAKQDRRLRDLMGNTAAPEPSSAVWNQMLARIEEGRRKPLPRRSANRYWLMAGACAASIVLVFGAIFALGRYLGRDLQPVNLVERPQQQPKAADEMEVLPVAAAHEIVVLRIEGADTAALAVGLLPLIGPLDLAAPGDVQVLNVRPDHRDRMVPLVRQDGPDRPMIWVQME